MLEKVVSGLGEYFFGTKTKRLYKDLENIEREWVLPENIGRRVMDMKNSLGMYIMASRTLPNAAIVISLYTNLPEFILFTEAFRIYKSKKLREHVEGYIADWYKTIKESDDEQSKEFHELLDEG